VKTNRNWYAFYQVVSFPMILSDSQGHDILRHQITRKWYTIYSVSQKKPGPLQLISHNFPSSQHLLIIFGTEMPYLFFCIGYVKKFSNWLRTSCVVSITTVAIWHTWIVDFWADFEKTYHRQDRNEWQNDCGAVLMTKESIRTRVVTFESAKHF